MSGFMHKFNTNLLKFLHQQEINNLKGERTSKKKIELFASNLCI